MIDNKILTKLNQLHTDLEFRRLHRGWAKVELMLGLIASGLGIAAMIWSVFDTQLGFGWTGVGGGLLLWVLGGYLTLAGHRSHIYQSTTLLTAYMIQKSEERLSK